jgi:hypothetical protein
VYLIDAAATNAITLRYGGLRDTHEDGLTNRWYTHSLQLTPTVLTANQVATAPLLHLISHIISVRSRKEMGRINTWGIVALVADKHPWRDVPDCYLK